MYMDLPFLVLAECKAAFARYDPNGTGQIDRANARPALRSLGFQLSTRETNALLDAVGITVAPYKSGPNMIDLPEFCACVRKQRRRLAEERRRVGEPEPHELIDATFRSLDRDGDGFISVTDLEVVLGVLGGGVAELSNRNATSALARTLSAGSRTSNRSRGQSIANNNNNNRPPLSLSATANFSNNNKQHQQDATALRVEAAEMIRWFDGDLDGRLSYIEYKNLMEQIVL